MKTFLHILLLICCMQYPVSAKTFNADNLKGSWLPSTNPMKKDVSAKQVDDFLKSLAGVLRPLVCSYDSSILSRATVFQNGKANLQDSQWTCDITKNPVAGHPEAMDLNIRFNIQKGRAVNTGLAAAFDFASWDPENYVLVPGAVYNGNRFRIIPEKYPPYIYNEKDKPLDMPVTVTNIPHLNANYSTAKIELLTGSSSTPLMSFYNKKTRRGFILLTNQQTRLGNSGMLIEENMSRKTATFVLSAPGVREKRYVMTGFVPSGDAGVNWEAGDEVVLKMRLFNFKASSLQEFFDKVFTVRKDLSGPTKYRMVEPFSSICDTILNHHDKTKWFDDGRYSYMSEYHGGKWPFQNIIQVGWGGAPVITFPYIICPTKLRLQRVTLTLDMLCKLQAPTGLMYAKFNQMLLGDNHRVMKEHPEIVLVRRFGETLYYGILNLEALKQDGNSTLIKTEWESMFRKLSDGLVVLWEKYGQFGQFVDVNESKIDVPGSSSGVSCAAALALAGKYYKNSRYLEVAEKAAMFYYNRDLVKGYAGGSARENMQSPDSESSYGFCDLFSILYDITGNPKYLQYAKDAVAYLSTWEISYDYIFPPASRLGMVDAKVTGAFMASCQNNHGSPSLWIHSGDFLLKLYRATGDKRVAELSKDLVHNVVQYVTTKTNPLIPNAASGSVSERVQISDWEEKENIGSQLPEGDSRLQWEVAVLLTMQQNPGIYLRTDKDDMIVYDHVNVEVLKRDNNGVQLKLTNSTSKDAKVSIFAENGEMAKKPLENTAFMLWPKVEVKAGHEVYCNVENSGKVFIK
jgi:hypothetical protein